MKEGIEKNTLHPMLYVDPLYILKLLRGGGFMEEKVKRRTRLKTWK